MDFSYSEDQQALQDSLRRYLDKHYTLDHRRGFVASADGFSRDAWRTYAELGLLALPFPEAMGGLGGQPIDTALVSQTLGRSLALEPYLATAVIGASLLRDTGTPAQRDHWVPRVAEGQAMLALAHGEPGRRYALAHVETRATRDGAGWRLSGSKSLVIGGASADALFVSARTAGGAGDASGVSLFLVPRAAAGLTVTPRKLHDGSQAADLRLADVALGADALVSTLDAALPDIERALDHGIAALCAEAVGIMLALNDATLDYLKTRKQFGVAIGSFQALQHRMGEMFIAAEQSRSMAELAALKLGSDDADERRRTVSAAKAYVGQQARFVGQNAVQLHGGMGVVDELVVSHLFKRLTLINATFGDVDHHLARCAQLLAA